jgi:predicted TIM-barrel fold metal-dependent hydrolase
VLSRRQLIAGAATAGMVAAANKVAYASPRWGRLIVDSQTHLWLANTPERPWFGKEAQLPEPFTIERLLSIIDEAGVDRVVLVPPTLEGERIDYVQEAVKRCPGRFGIMCRIAIDKPERASKLPAWRDQAGVLGVRLNYGSPWLTNGTADWFWPAAEKANLPVMLLTNGQNSLIGPIAERHPGLTIIIDHMGISTAFMRTTQTWGDEIDNAVAGLARYPNVSVKLSSIPLFSTEPYPWRDTIPHIHRLYDVFGPGVGLPQHSPRWSRALRNVHRPGADGKSCGFRGLRDVLAAIARCRFYR